MAMKKLGGMSGTQGGVGKFNPNAMSAPFASDAYTVPLPSFGMETQGPTDKPRFRGGLEVPFMGGDLGFEGSYQSKEPTSDYGFGLRYRRQF